MSMHSTPGVTELPDDFDGQVRLFPLPGLVLFPHAMQPLHVFEPRYVEMLRESLASDHLIAMATLTGNGEQAAVTEPSIHPTVCIGKVISHAELENDRHNILLVGMRRASIRRELDAGRPFRMAQIDLIDDFYLPSGTPKRGGLKKRLLQAFGKIIPPTTGSQKSLHNLMQGQMGVGPITDIIAYTLPFPAQAKLRLLAMSDVDARAEALIELIEAGVIELNTVNEEDADQPWNSSASSSGPDQFPPPFSVN